MRREELLMKVISGNATPAENNKFQLWVEASESNRKEYEQQQLIWQFVGTSKKEVEVDVEAAWMRFAELKEQVEDRPSKIIYRIAAALIVLLMAGSIGTYLFFGNQKAGFSTIAKVIVPEKKIEAQIQDDAKTLAQIVERPLKQIGYRRATNRINNKPAYVEYVLVDSSTVKLTNHSALKFLDYSTNNSRIASLSGAGVFDIKPSNQLFILETDDIIVHVEGTKFDISSPTSENQFVEIYVEEGSMDVFDKQNLDNKISLTSGQKYVFDIQKREFKLAQTESKSNNKWKRFWKKFSNRKKN